MTARRKVDIVPDYIGFQVRAARRGGGQLPTLLTAYRLQVGGVPASLSLSPHVGLLATGWARPRPTASIYLNPEPETPTQCPNRWIVGHGMDTAQIYRSLPYIGVLSAEAQARFLTGIKK